MSTGSNYTVEIAVITYQSEVDYVVSDFCFSRCGTLLRPLGVVVVQFIVFAKSERFHLLMMMSTRLGYWA